MHITLHFHTILQETPEGRRSRLDLDTADDSTVGDLLAGLAVRLPADALIVLVNGRVVDDDHVVRDGDEVHLIPALSGGTAAGLPPSRRLPPQR